MRWVCHKGSVGYQEIMHESTLSYGLTYDASVWCFILHMCQVHTLQPLCLRENVFGMEEWSCVKAREEMIVLGGNDISASGSFFAYLVVQGVMTGYSKRASWRVEYMVSELPQILSNHHHLL